MENQKPLTIQFPSQGWTQFLNERKGILDAYDKARNQSRIHEVQTFHGNVGESHFRKWLTSFLPRKYGVTSGYVISPGLSHQTKVPHYDVIIYEKLESPILWVEENADASAQGMSQAIPAEFVKAVIEVKSSFNNNTVKSAVEHLNDLNGLMIENDAIDERYRLYLPKTFFSAIVFMELREADFFDKSAMNNLLNVSDLRDFYGGIILRVDGKNNDVSGSLRLVQSPTDVPSTISKPDISLLSGLVKSDCIYKAPGNYQSSMLYFTDGVFSAFAFDIVALLNGTFKPNMVSSFLAHGTSNVETEW
jgi:hypothetical protein